MTIDEELEQLGQRIFATPDEQAYISVETRLMKALVMSWMDYQAFSGRQARYVQQMREQSGTIREALAKIVGVFDAGVYCSNCGESVDDCDCIISKGRAALK